MGVSVVEANFRDNDHCSAITYLLNEYALDPMGGGEPLSKEVKDNLTSTMAKLPHVFSVLCFVDGSPAGLVNCVEGFSTFSCKPLVNIHDVVVHESYRGLGLTHQMFEKVQAIAVSKGACKLTLEVLEGNTIARNAYIKNGFDGYELNPEMGKALFWQKKL